MENGLLVTSIIYLLILLIEVILKQFSYFIISNIFNLKYFLFLFLFLLKIWSCYYSLPSGNIGTPTLFIGEVGERGLNYRLQNVAALGKDRGNARQAGPQARPAGKAHVPVSLIGPGSPSKSLFCTLFKWRLENARIALKI